MPGGEFFLIEEQVILLLFIASLVGIAARRLRMPYTVGLVLVGLGLTLFGQVHFEISSDLILGLLIPPLVFEAAYHLNFLDLQRNLKPILILAIPGVLVTTFLVGGVVSLGIGFPITIALLSGALVAATDPDAVIALIRSLGVPKRLARLKDPSYEEAYRQSGITRIMRVADLLINQLMVEIEQPEVKKVMSLGGGSADVYAIRIPPDAWCIDKPVSNIGSLPEFPDECLLMGVFQHDTEEFAIPRGGFVLHEGDTVFLIARPADVKQMADILTRTRKNRLLSIMKGEKHGS